MDRPLSSCLTEKSQGFFPQAWIRRHSALVGKLPMRVMIPVQGNVPLMPYQRTRGKQAQKPKRSIWHRRGRAKLSSAKTWFGCIRFSVEKRCLRIHPMIRPHPPPPESGPRHYSLLLRSHPQDHWFGFFHRAIVSIRRWPRDHVSFPPMEWAHGVRCCPGVQGATCLQYAPPRRSSTVTRSEKSQPFRRDCCFSWNHPLMADHLDGGA
jgi:hypothetical protein